LNLNEIKGNSDSNVDFQALDKKHNSKKLLSLNAININNNINNIIKLTIDPGVNTNFAPDSPSNKVFSMKILTFGQNCNFPNEKIENEEEDDDLGINFKIKNEKNHCDKMSHLRSIKTEFNTDLLSIDNSNKKNKILKIKDVDKMSKKINKKYIIEGS